MHIPVEGQKVSLSLSTLRKAWVSDILGSCTLQDQAIHPFVHWICRGFTIPLCIFPLLVEKLGDKEQIIQSSTNGSYHQLKRSAINNLLVLLQQIKCGRFCILIAKLNQNICYSLQKIPD